MAPPRGAEGWRRERGCAHFPGTALSLASLLALGRAGAEPVPTPITCPQCAFQDYSCEGGCPKPGQPGLRHHEVDFRHASTPNHCLEQIPGDGRTLYWDMDTRCAGFTFVTCDNMAKFDFHGIAMLTNCSKPDDEEKPLVKEDCMWICKNRRPYSRCRWKFDSARNFESSGVSTLERCWVRQTCRNDRLGASAVCRPIDLHTIGQAASNETLENLQDYWKTVQDHYENHYAMVEESFDQRQGQLLDLQDELNKWKAEAEHHEQTSEEQEELITILCVTGAVLCAVIFFLVMVILYLLYIRKRSKIETIDGNNAGNYIVVGKPVAEDGGGSRSPNGQVPAKQAVNAVPVISTKSVVPPDKTPNPKNPKGLKGLDV